MVSYFSNKEWKLLGFRKSTKQFKKYDAILQNIKTLKEKIIPFGDNRYEQFYDGILGLYSHKNHYDNQRRLLYRQRHKKDLKNGYYSAGHFSYYGLWG